MAAYELPPLPYDYAALEPHYSARQVELHHDKHHATYVKGANDTLEQFDAFRSDGASNQQVLRGLERALAFNVSGHLLHSVFWPSMRPDGGGYPEGELKAAIEDAFGSVDNLKSQMNLATTTLFGSGWGALVWEPLAGRLMVEQIYDHQSNMSPSSLPLLVIDGWEHSYYLQYENRKDDWVKAFWEIVNWERVAARLEHARVAVNPSVIAMA
ncbi:MAG: superoxide dismutase, Fe-Mn family [Actinomycetota bacterium]|nr:superoxide dismutase, Fe-Mn family [Actinomycetota bacterium]